MRPTGKPCCVLLPPHEGAVLRLVEESPQVGGNFLDRRAVPEIEAQPARRVEGIDPGGMVEDVPHAAAHLLALVSG